MNVNLEDLSSIDYDTLPEYSSLPADFCGESYVQYYSSICKGWYKNGKLHREDGPAIIRLSDKTEIWYFEGRRHRIGGPAQTYFQDLETKIKIFMLNEEYFSEKNYWKHPLVLEYKLNKILDNP